ncbi:MAG: hypothetical protein ACYC75_00675 [Minisyncoccota bacterium]
MPTTRVLLVPSHHIFRINGGLFATTKSVRIPEQSVDLTEEMLAWPFCSEDGDAFNEEANRERAPAYRNCLQALLSLAPFTSAICIYADIGKRILYSLHRQWGQIYFQDEAVANFSHDRRRCNFALRSILEWPEIDDHDTVRAWTIEQWRMFFLRRIAEEMKEMITFAQHSAVRPQKELGLAEEVLRSLPGTAY